MPCTIIYVDTTAAPMVQARKNRLLGFLKKLLENMMGRNSFLIIITPNNKMQAFKKAETIIQRVGTLYLKGTYHHYMLSYNFLLPLIGNFLSILSPPIYNIFLLPPLFNPPPTRRRPSLVLGPWWQPLSSPPSPPPTPRLQTRMAVAV